jgi:PilZ domain
MPIEALTATRNSRYTGQERRASPRIETPFPATVRGVDVDAQLFEEYMVLDNFSSSGLYLRLARPVQQGIRLFVLIRLSVSSKADALATYIALRGVVLRSEPRPGGIFGTALRLTHHRFIYAASRPELAQTAWIHSA